MCSVVVQQWTSLGSEVGGRHPGLRWGQVERCRDLPVGLSGFRFGAFQAPRDICYRIKSVRWALPPPDSIYQRADLGEAGSDIHLGTSSRAGVMAPWGCGVQVMAARERGGLEKVVPAVPGYLPSFTEDRTKQQERPR